MILCNKLKNGLCKILTKLIVTKLKLHCSLWVGWLASRSQIGNSQDCWHEVILRKSAYLQGFWSKSEALLYSCQAACHPEPSRPPYSTNNKWDQEFSEDIYVFSTFNTFFIKSYTVNKGRTGHFLSINADLSLSAWFSSLRISNLLVK